MPWLVCFSGFLKMFAQFDILYDFELELEQL